MPPLPVPEMLLCPPVLPCRLPASHPTTNGDVLRALEQAQAAWAHCAAQVEMIDNCQSHDQIH
jgi:hypothetical protein